MSILKKLIIRINNTTFHNIIINMAWLLFDKILRLGVGLIVSVWMARYLGPSKFGLLSFAIAFVGIFSSIAGLGLPGIVVREIVKLPNEKNAILGSAAILQLFAGIVAYVIMIIAICILRIDDKASIILVAILGSATLFKSTEISNYWFESQVLSKYTVWVQNSTFIFFALLKVSLIIFRANILAFAWAIIAETFVAAMVLLLVMNKVGVKILGLRFSRVRAKLLLRDAIPLFLSAVAIMIGMRIDQVMIGQMLPSNFVGYYSVAVRLAEVAIFLGMVVAQSIFPRFIGLDDINFKKEFVFLLRYPFFMLLVTSSLISLFSSFIINLIFGYEYSLSAPALSVLVFSIPLTFVSIMSTNYLLKYGFHNEILLRQATGVIINIIINAFLIPRYKIVGAAIATVFTDLFISIGFDIIRIEFRELLKLKIKAFLFR